MDVVPIPQICSMRIISTYSIAKDTNGVYILGTPEVNGFQNASG